jgi:hypothetical protein
MSTRTLGSSGAWRRPNRSVLMRPFATGTGSIAAKGAHPTVEIADHLIDRREALGSTQQRPDLDSVLVRIRRKKPNPR